MYRNNKHQLPSPYGASAKSKKRKLVRNALAPISHPYLEETSPHKQLSITQLEEKKTLLPYLEKIEYINQQLQQRGVQVSSKPLPSPVKNQEHEENVSSSRSEKDEYPLNLPLTMPLLWQRYPRFCSTIAPSTLLVLRDRPVQWLLRLVEELYDQYYAVYCASQCLSSFPLYVRQYLVTTLGRSTLADQECVDLIYNVERQSVHFPHLPLFASFVREIEDEEYATFYCHVRATIQTHFGLSLKLKEKLLLQDNIKKFHTSGAIVLADHKILRDGTQVVYLSEEACIHGLYHACFLDEKTLARHYVQNGLHTMFEKVVTVAPPLAGLVSMQEKTQNVIPLDMMLSSTLVDLHKVPEDILAKYKFNDDGESLTLLTRLHDTITHENSISQLKLSLEEETTALKRLQIERMKLDRVRQTASIEDQTKYKTQIFLLDNQIQTKIRDVDHIKHNINQFESQVNSVWSSVIKDGNQPKQLPRSPLDNIIIRFRDAIARLYQAHLLQQKVAARVLAKQKKYKGRHVAWGDQLEDLQERSACKIQRLFRQRRAWRRERHLAQKELETRRQAHRKRKAEKEMEKKRLEALRARDAEKHKARLQEKKKRENDALEAQHAKEKAIVIAAASTQAEKRCALAKLQLMARIWQCWLRFVLISKRTSAAKKTSLHGIFLRWKGYATFRSMLHRAATKIQATYRGHVGRKQANLAARRQQKKDQLAHRSVLRLRNRFLFTIINRWRLYTFQQMQVRDKCLNLMQRSLHATLTQWSRILLMKRASALLIQRVVRGHWGRQAANYRRKLIAASLLVQRAYRGHLARRVFKFRQQLKQAQNTGAVNLLHKMVHRTKCNCFQAWKSRWDLKQLYKAREHQRAIRCRNLCFTQWILYRQNRQRKRAEKFRRQFAAATCIQRQIRGYLGRKHYQALLQRYYAAQCIQRNIRGFMCRQFYRRVLAIHRYALKIQCGWRRRKAIILVTRLRNESILNAAVRGDYSVVLRSFHTGRAWIADEDGNSLLHLACLGGSKRVIKLCLRNGMDINCTNSTGKTPLHLLVAATHEHRAELLNYMIDHGAWHEACDLAGETPLLVASALGHVDCIRVLLQRAANAQTISATTHLSAIATAVSFNYVEAVEVLLDLGACSPDTSDPNDNASLLHDCAARGYLELAKLLVSRGATIDVQDCDGHTPAMYAIYNDHIEILRYLLTSGAVPDVKNNAGMAAVHMGIAKCEMIKTLGEFGADVNLSTAEGESPLHLSCKTDALLESSRVLLSFGASIDSKDRRGNQPAHIAARNGAAKTMELFIEYGANMNMRNYDNKNPLGEARMYHQLGVVEVIKFHFAQDMKLLEEAGEILTDEDGIVLPERTMSEWLSALETCKHISTLNDWRQCLDTATGALFYHEITSNHCSWRAPVEFLAALGEHWRPVERDGVFVYQHEVTGEVSEKIPPIDPLRLQALVQGVDAFKMLRSRIHKVSSETAASSAQYRSFWTEFDKETKEARLYYQSAVKIQKTYKGYLYRCRLHILKIEHKTALHLQRVFRGRIARREAARQRHRLTCAITIQAYARGYLVRLHERQWWHQWRVERRRERLGARDIQRVWRGMHGRWYAKRLQVIKTGPQSFFEWSDAKKHAKVVRTFQVWQELQLANTLPIVGYFYCNQITGQCVWDKPTIWITHDYNEFLDRQQLYYYGYTSKMLKAALLIQSLYRARIARVYFHRLLEGVRLAKTCEKVYMDDPTNMTKLGNYSLYLHALLHDYDRAALMYGRLVDLMAARGPDIPFVLRCYGIYLFVTQQDESQTIAVLFDRADKVDRTKKKFQLAFLGFFRYSVVLFPENAQSHVNYAACLDWVYHNIKDATHHYLKALELDPYNERIAVLFNDMLERAGLLENGNASELFMQYQAKQVEKEDAQRRQEFLQAEENNRRQAAAICIQTRFRARKGVKVAQRTRLDLLLNKNKPPKSELDLKLEAAFMHVAKKNKNGVTIRLAQLGSVYEQLGLPFRAADEDMTYSQYFGEFDYPESITLTRFLKWWHDGAAPEAWEACTSQEGYVYYYNSSTGTSVWDKPRFQRSLIPESTPEWEECYSQDGAVYYYNVRTGASCWENPQSVLPPWEVAYDGHNNVYFYNQETGESVWTIAETLKATKATWEAVQTDDGQVYYYNNQTGETSWTPPELPQDWEAIVDDQGATYYYNRVTGVSQWEAP